jgi:hypothetical protein
VVGFGRPMLDLPLVFVFPEFRFGPATPATPATQASNPYTYEESAGGAPSGTIGGTPAESLPPLAERHLEEAGELGLVARWSKHFGCISVHDPTEGTWHDVAVEDAPAWAKNEAFTRKELYKAGYRRAYGLTARQMEELREAEQVEMWDQPYRPHDARDGLVYDVEEREEEEEEEEEDDDDDEEEEEEEEGPTESEVSPGRVVNIKTGEDCEVYIGHRTVGTA